MVEKLYFLPVFTGAQNCVIRNRFAVAYQPVSRIIVYEAATRTIDENAPTTATKADADEADSREVVLPGLTGVYMSTPRLENH